GVRKTLQDVTRMIEKTMKGRHKSAKVANKASREAIKSLNNERKALMKNARNRERIMRRLDKAEKLLADRRKQRADYAGSVRQGVLDYGSITGLGAAFNADAMLAEMRKRINKVKQYNALLARLMKQGLNKSMID